MCKNNTGILYLIKLILLSHFTEWFFILLLKSEVVIIGPNLNYVYAP